MNNISSEAGGHHRERRAATRDATGTAAAGKDENRDRAARTTGRTSMAARPAAALLAVGLKIRLLAALLATTSSVGRPVPARC